MTFLRNLLSEERKQGRQELRRKRVLQDEFRFKTKATHSMEARALRAISS